MNILIVGAGSVGQVYGYYLASGGATVTYLVKGKYVSELKAGLKLFPLNQARNPEGINFKNYQVISELSEVRKTVWDYIILTVPSDALYTPWLKEFAAEIRPGTPVVSLQPGPNDREELAKFIPVSHLLSGIISLIAFSTPLDGKGPQEKGTAYWLPPLVRAPFDGDPQLLKGLLRVFQRSHFPCMHKTFLNQSARIAFGGTFLGVFIKVLSERGWKLDDFIETETAQIFLNELKYYYGKISQRYGIPESPVLQFLKPGMLAWMVRVSKWILPFDVETYLRVHFTKVGPQMRLNLQNL